MSIFGMLWFDNTKTSSLPDKLRKSISYYLDKYHRIPDIVQINPLDFNNHFQTNPESDSDNQERYVVLEIENQREPLNILVEASKSIQINHQLIGHQK